MQKIFNIIKETIEGGNYILIVVIAFLLILFNANLILQFFEKIKKNKLNSFLEIKQDLLDKDVKDSLVDSINSEIFKITTGMSINEFYREKIIDLYKTHNGEISLINLKKILQYMRIENNKLKIVITRVDTAEFWFNIIGASILSLAGMILVAISTQFGKLNLEFITNFFGGLFMLSFAIFIFNLAWNYKMAKKIQQIMNKESHQ